MTDKGSTRLREQEFAESASLVRDRQWTAAKLTTDAAFYLNGQPRSRSEYGSDEGAKPGDGWLQLTEYHDNGKVLATGRYSVQRQSRQWPVGMHERFDESGKRVAQTEFDDRGRPMREKAWDANGNLIRDDAVFEDGSRKAFAR